jgi:hypothetical protein
VLAGRHTRLIKFEVDKLKDLDQVKNKQSQSQFMKYRAQYKTSPEGNLGMTGMTRLLKFVVREKSFAKELGVNRLCASRSPRA